MNCLERLKLDLFGCEYWGKCRYCKYNGVFPDGCDGFPGIKCGVRSDWEGRPDARLKPKIAIFHPEFCVRGGAERKVLLIAHALKEEYDITILTFRWEPKNCFPKLCKGLNVKIIGGWKPLALVKMAISGRKFSLIHASNNPVHLASALTKFLFRKPVIWFCNETQLYLPDVVNRKNKVLLFSQRIVERLILRFINTIVANSEYTATMIRENLKRIPVIIYSGVDTKKYSPGKKKLSDTTRLFLLSRIEKHKQIDFLLDCLSEIKSKCDVLLTIAGDGTYLKKLKNKVVKQNIEGVSFLGRVSEREKIKLLRGSDIFVFPTKNEPLGVTVLEAISCGLPVVAFDSGGVSETIGHNEGGCLVDDKESFVNTLVQLAGNKKQREKLGELGRKRVEKMFSVEQMIEKTNALYRGCLGIAV